MWYSQNAWIEVSPIQTPQVGRTPDDPVHLGVVGHEHTDWK